MVSASSPFTFKYFELNISKPLESRRFNLIIPGIQLVVDWLKCPHLFPSNMQSQPSSLRPFVLANCPYVGLNPITSLLVVLTLTTSCCVPKDERCSFVSQKTRTTRTQSGRWSGTCCMATPHPGRPDGRSVPHPIQLNTPPPPKLSPPCIYLTNKALKTNKHAFLAVHAHRYGSLHWFRSYPWVRLVWMQSELLCLWGHCSSSHPVLQGTVYFDRSGSPHTAIHFIWGNHVQPVSVRAHRRLPLPRIIRCTIEDS